MLCIDCDIQSAARWNRPRSTGVALLDLLKGPGILSLTVANQMPFKKFTQWYSHSNGLFPPGPGLRLSLNLEDPFNYLSF